MGIDLGQSIWQTIISLSAIFITILLYLLQRRKKSLVYEIWETSLLTMNEKMMGRVRIEYGGKLIQELNLIELKVQNDGNIPIASADFEQPLSFELISAKKNPSILSAEVSAVIPATIKPVIKIERNCLTVLPLLLNKKDTLFLKILVNEYNHIQPICVKVSTRIIGVTGVRRKSSLSPQSRIKEWLDVGIGALFLCGVAVGIYGFFTSRYSGVSIGLAILIFSSLVSMIEEYTIKKFLNKNHIHEDNFEKTGTRIEPTRQYKRKGDRHVDKK